MRMANFEAKVTCKGQSETLRDLKGLIRGGPLVTSAGVKKWIGEARERSTPDGPRRWLER